jgi:hypothetical protein
MMMMILTLLVFKPKREKIAMATQQTKLNLKVTKRNSARIRNLLSLLKFPFLKDPTNYLNKRMNLHLIMAQTKETKQRMTPRKRRALKPNALIQMRRRISHKNSRMAFAMEMKTSAKRDTNSFQLLLLEMLIQPQLVFYKLKTQRSIS